ncbi:unnamed protein product (macronuclear) [Paramecium tetraurelia]|uniref:Uncharacterized protein n=1 Tax=Paramecium tetraurelia TaxID=5888 RepID=A0E3H9_PARTE|nr:uncharacterized protein GSPATT00023019001 [Paramecium tetraurelia]CAK89846.1 unnamed protein product [Paramecium tetraurelia]|eukprot:XP_001457243.1 hypothetical protein (macronuclear) [Paramecium tetraurelia strain d4-2]
MNKLEQKAVHSLLQLAKEEETRSERNWEPQSPKQNDFISPQPKSINQHRKNIRIIQNHKARQKSSIEINQDDDQQLSQPSQKENSLQQLIEEYMKQIRHTQRQLESIHQSKFDLKSGWVNFSSIILENKAKVTKKKHQRKQSTKSITTIHTKKDSASKSITQ